MAVTATGFITDAELKAAVAASLSKTDQDAIDADIWDANIARRNLGAYRQITSAWASAGFTLAQITTWDLGPVFQENLALYEAMIKQNPARDQVGEWREELDYWRQELKDLVKDKALVASGALLLPGDAKGELYEIHTWGY